MWIRVTIGKIIYFFHSLITKWTEGITVEMLNDGTTRRKNRMNDWTFYLQGSMLIFLIYDFDMIIMDDK